MKQTPRTDPTPRQRIYGLGIALLYVLIFYALTYLSGFIVPALAIFIGVIALPIVLGIAVQCLADPTMNQTLGRLYAWSMVVIGLISLILMLIEIETLICIVIASPFFILIIPLGIGIARKTLGLLKTKFDTTTLRLSLLVAPFVLFPMVPSLDFPMREVAYTTQVTIDAPITTVWDHTVEINAIQPDERIWTISHHLLGAPQPVHATLDGHIRQLRWTHDVRFEEHITNRIEGTLLEWDFVFHDPDSLAAFDPHISPTSSYLNLHSGQYRLTPLPNGQTQLDLTTRYRLATPYNWYLVMWGDLFLNDFHSAVLTVIKTRAESA